MISENLREVEEKISQACLRAGRERSEVLLIAVSKTKPLEMVEEAAGCNQIDFGENKVQELCMKYEHFPTLRWHMIGHLQRNKVKQVVDKAFLIHSVDSIRLAETIEAEAAKINTVARVLLEVNVAEEESKFGFHLDQVMEAVEQISKMEHIHILGLMTIAPFVEDPEENRPVFQKLRQLSVDIKEKNMNNVNMDVLSMGMTNDYEVAVEEGATMVRVGTGIFGERDYSTTAKIGE